MIMEMENAKKHGDRMAQAVTPTREYSKHLTYCMIASGPRLSEMKKTKNEARVLVTYY
jgi:hypothetical protein